MAVAKHRTSANTMPNHIAQPAIGAPYNDWIWKVSQRKAPGAISAMALMVSPVRPRVGLVVGWEADCGSGMGVDYVVGWEEKTRRSA
jgi:hypothetical protein